MTYRHFLLTAAAAASLGLAACDQNASAPSAPVASLTPDQAALAEAPIVLPLPPAAPLPARRGLASRPWLRLWWQTWAQPPALCRWTAFTTTTPS
jgi:hypothetical protein